jgi:hypothetical protein
LSLTESSPGKNTAGQEEEGCLSLYFPLKLNRTSIGVLHRSGYTEAEVIYSEKHSESKKTGL